MQRNERPTPATERTWNAPITLLLAELQATPAGLTDAEARQRLAAYGGNDALSPRRLLLWRQILDRFANPLILILLFAGGLSAWTGDVASFLIITVILLLSVVLDLIQQRRAENAVEALRRSVALRARVLRQAREQTVPVEQLVPGDVVRLKRCALKLKVLMNGRIGHRISIAKLCCFLEFSGLSQMRPTLSPWKWPHCHQKRSRCNAIS